MRTVSQPKLRVLCLHSFRTSGAIFKQQIERSGFNQVIHDLVDLEFVNATHVATGPAPGDVAAHFEPPYFQWWDATTADTADGKVSTYSGWEAAVEDIRATLARDGPFDGIMGFSQGAALTACAAALQESQQLSGAQEEASVKFVVMIAGFTPRDPALAALFARPLELPSFHIIGERDVMQRSSAQLLTHFDVRTVLWHQQGHVVPRLAEDQQRVLREFLLEFEMAQPRL